MKFWYLNHSGFAVETEKHLLVFDYYTNAPAGGTLEQGVVTPELLPPDKQLVVFVSHAHYDHYNKVVHRWQAEQPTMLLFLGDDIPPCPGAVTVAAGSTAQIQGITVTALRSTDQGVAYLVQVDGKAIYHAGDLHWWHWMGEPEEQNRQVALAYQSQVDRLKGQRIDLAFLPVDPRLGPAAFWGAQYFMSAVGASRMVPMHLWEEYSICEQFAADPESAAFRDRVLPISHRGQCYSL